LILKLFKSPKLDITQMIKMQKTIISLSIILIGSIVANTSHAWTQAGKFRDWGVAVNDKNCAAWTLSKKSNTKTEMIVLFAKGQNTADVHFKIPNLLSKYQLKKAKLEVLGAEYDYQLNITEQSIASSTPANKKLIISAFRKGSDVKSNWSINDGKNRSSSFSLMGFTAAFLKAAEKCGAEKFALTTAPGNQTNTKKLVAKTTTSHEYSEIIQNVLVQISYYHRMIIWKKLKDHTNFNGGFNGKLSPNLISSFEEYSQKFIAPENAFHSINSNDSAKKFFMSFLDQSELENVIKLEREQKEKLEREKKEKQEKEDLLKKLKQKRLDREQKEKLRKEKEEQEKFEREKIIKKAYLKLNQTQRMDIIRVLRNNFAYVYITQSGWDETIISYIKRYNNQLNLQNGKSFNLLNPNDVDELLIIISNHEKADRAEFAEKLKAHELMLTDKNRIGFRDFYIGMDSDIFSYLKNGAILFRAITFKNEDGKKCKPSNSKPRGDICYGLDYKFSFSTGMKLNKIRVYILNYVQSSSYIGNLFNMGTSEDPVVNLINSLNKKYKKSYSYSENERLLFNDGETDELYIAYEDGQVIFSLERVDDGSYDTDIYAYITYRNKSDGLKFLDAIKPKTAISDF